jgi:hypothetical protein
MSSPEWFLKRVLGSRRSRAVVVVEQGPLVPAFEFHRAQRFVLGLDVAREPRKASHEKHEVPREPSQSDDERMTKPSPQ